MITSSKTNDARVQYSLGGVKSTILDTLLVQVFRRPKKGLLLIQRSRPSRESQEPKTTTTTKNQFSRGLFKKIPFLYFFLHKAWIWRTLGHVMDIFSYCHFHIVSKECFWPKKIQISCMGSKVSFWKNCPNFSNFCPSL